MSKPLPAYFRWKLAVDRAVATLLLLPGVPLIFLLCCLIRLTSAGPAIYSQRRVGRGRRTYTMYKLRSMRIDAESKSGAVWSVPGTDARVTALGYWLRKLHLDELPQLFNVLRGEMSLIGPRPERPEFVKTFLGQIPNYERRLEVLPGITGLAQINLPPDVDIKCVYRKLKLDIEYIETASFTLDVRMFVCTLFRLVGVNGEAAMKVMALKRGVPATDVLEVVPDVHSLLTPHLIAKSLHSQTAEGSQVRVAWQSKQPSHAEISVSVSLEPDTATVSG